MFVLPLPAARLLAVVLGLVLLVTLSHAFTVDPNARAMAPKAISFDTYATRRAAGMHPMLDTQAAADGAPLPSPTATHVAFVHINDLYELISSGPLGGVARLATLLRQTQALNAPGHTKIVLAGDLFSPSALSTVAVNDSASGFQGKQMVAVMNAMGLDLAVLGNHETDIKASEFTARLAESHFPWTCANALDMYPGLQREAVVYSFDGGAPGRSPVSIGVWGINLDKNNKPYESYQNFTESLVTAAASVAALQVQSVDAIVALTHLPYYHDQTLTQTVQGIDIVMGGHEHVAMRIECAGLAPIYKADSNVHSAWIHDFFIDPSRARTDPQHTVIQSSLISIDHSLEEDPSVLSEINFWVGEAFEGFAAQGFAPADFLATPTEDLVGTNDAIFAGDTLLTQIFNLALLEECDRYGNATFTVPVIDATLFNSGAIRIDDTIPAGTPMTQYDAIRISPYLNAVALVKMTGRLLLQTMQVSWSVQNDSQFIHAYPNITLTDAAGDGGFLVNGKPIVPDRWYNVGVLGYLLRGDSPYEFLALAASPQDIQEIVWDQSGQSDVRRSILNQIAIRFPSNGPPTPSGGGDDDGGSKRVFGIKLWLFLALCGAALALLVAACVFVRRCMLARQRRSQLHHGDSHIDFSPTGYDAAQKRALAHAQYNLL